MCHYLRISRWPTREKSSSIDIDADEGYRTKESQRRRRRIVKRLFIEWLEWETTHREMPPGEMFSTTSRRRSINTGHYSCPLQLSSSLDFSREPANSNSRFFLYLHPRIYESRKRITLLNLITGQSFFRFGETNARIRIYEEDQNVKE